MLQHTSQSYCICSLPPIFSSLSVQENDPSKLQCISFSPVRGYAALHGLSGDTLLLEAPCVEEISSIKHIHFMDNMQGTCSPYILGYMSNH